jgi:hypothetical protein
VDNDDLERLAADLKSDRVERKPSLAQAKEIRQAICAFATDPPDHGQPGVIFIGLESAGRCARLTVDEKLLHNPLARGGTIGEWEGTPANGTEDRSLPHRPWRWRSCPAFAPCQRY